MTPSLMAYCTFINPPTLSARASAWVCRSSSVMVAACSLLAHSLAAAGLIELERQSHALARALKVGGLMNVQYAIKDGVIYVLEVNPRASRTVPFVAKVIGLPVAKLAARIMAGEPLASFGLQPQDFSPGAARHVGVK